MTKGLTMNTQSANQTFVESAIIRVAEPKRHFVGFGAQIGSGQVEHGIAVVSFQLASKFHETVVHVSGSMKSSCQITGHVKRLNRLLHCLADIVRVCPPEVPRSGWPECENALAIRLQRRRVNSIHGGPRHQSNGPDRLVSVDVDGLFFQRTLRYHALHS